MLQTVFLLSFALVPIGEIDALKGEIVHTRAVLFAVEEGRAYTHRDPQETVRPPKGAVAIAAPEVCKKDKRITVTLPLGEAETAVAQTQGAVGPISNATILLVRGGPADDLLGYAPYYVRVYDKGELVASYDMRADSYPCSVLIDNFDEVNGNEVAVGWLSVAAGYTAGATIFRLEEREPEREGGREAGDWRWE